MAHVEIRNLHSIAEQAKGIEVFDTTWPIAGGGTEITSNFMQALVHNGCYFAGAFLDGKIIGAAFGFIGINGGPHLHSHMAAVLPEYRDLSVGTKLKLHQYEWANNNQLPFITWTFDPLVKRNARLNLLKLGVEVASYHPNFYGAMIDDLNAGDESDRLMAKWLITDKGPQPREEILNIPDGAITIAIPDDIVEIRMRDVQETFAYRFEVREKFQRAFSSGYSVIGFSNTHGYVLDKK